MNDGTWNLRQRTAGPIEHFFPLAEQEHRVAGKVREADWTQNWLLKRARTTPQQRAAAELDAQFRRMSRECGPAKPGSLASAFKTEKVLRDQGLWGDWLTLTINPPYIAADLGRAAA